MQSFLAHWSEAATTSLGLFWMALWAFGLGYLASSIIQVFVSHKSMKNLMGGESAKSVGLGTFFGFISSSCSFAALATTKSLFKKGAGFVPSMAFLLASTNLVVELGIVIGLFLSWQFVIGEYIGGILLILCSWAFIKFTKPKKLIQAARKKLNEGEEKDQKEEQLKLSLFSTAAWKKVSMQYKMEWGMVWKDVSVGFTLAGIIAAFVPASFFQSLFIGTANHAQADLSFFQVLEHVVIGPLAAFFTFIGSMGNIPLAALLFSNGVSFAGVMAFIFSDLVVFPVLRINARYYGWKLSLYILLMLFSALVLSTLLLHYGLLSLDLLPEFSKVSIKEMQYFKIDYGFWLNLLFIALSVLMLVLASRTKHQHGGHKMPEKPLLEKIMKYLAYLSYAWLTIGVLLHFFIH